jgi:peptidoglycan/LPS O-acetylase OafA/YrhL
MFFFVLSGFVLTRTLRKTSCGPLTRAEYASWFAQRTVRLCLPAAAAVLISAMFYSLSDAHSWSGEVSWLAETWRQQYTPAAILGQALLIARDGDYGLDNVLWSLVHEWRVSLLLPTGLATFRGRSGAVLLVLLGVAISSTAAGNWGDLILLGPSFGSSLRATLYFLLPFSIGAALDLGDVAAIRVGRWHVMAAAFAVPSLAQVGSDYATFLASALVIWLALQPGLIQNQLRRPVLVWLGAMSVVLPIPDELAARLGGTETVSCGRGANKPYSGSSARSTTCKVTPLRSPRNWPPVTFSMRQPVTELREATRQPGCRRLCACCGRCR